jgi:predicted anti-sigma-YlaC factor YlaD
MESRSEHSPPEQQAWKTKYFSPPQPPARTTQPDVIAQDTQSHFGVTTPQTSLCARVREQLQDLLENEGDLKPETVSALYGHLAVCGDCTREYEMMQRVVDMLEGLPLAELPKDYSRLIMGRIQNSQAEPPQEISTARSVGLCVRVREKLQLLLENDPEIKPDMVTALYGHLAVCAECSGEFQTMRRLVNMMETLPTAELPMDYSAQIMQRIQAGAIPAALPVEVSASRPTLAASSLASGEAAVHSTRLQTGQQSITQTGMTTQLTTKAAFWQRLLLSVALSGLFVYLLASNWGRQMLGVNLETARIWLSQISDHLGPVPALGPLVGGIGAALLSLNEALSYTFAAVGSMAAQTLALEVALGVAACLLVSARRPHTIQRT